MNPFDVGSIQLDRCTFCRGLWFDGGELDQVLGKKMSPQIDEGQSARKCAACSLPMANAVLGGLRVETCLKCHGVFLDEGELVKLNGGKPVRVREDVTDWLASLGV
jgi:Zn-finger nucleic acid-binding protein